MRIPAETQVPDYFSHNLGVRLEQLVAPVSDEQPCGESLRASGVYRAIQEARREDDASLPLGPWTHELKKADWDNVCALVTEALAKRSKDLQLAAWLLEARIHCDGFAGIAPCVTLMRVLCERHWDNLYPRADDGDIEFRTNVIHWTNEKLLPVLRLVPLTNTGRDERALNWADWEQAKRNEQHRGMHGDKEPLEGVTLSDFSSAMAATPTEWHCELHGELYDALSSLEGLNATLDELCGQEAPGLTQLIALLEQISTLIAAEVHKRGVRLDREGEPGAPARSKLSRGSSGGAAGVGSMDPSSAGAAGHGSSAWAAGAPRDRAMAYTRLSELADYLQQIEPHSPVPYLLKRAIIWGGLNTSELYREMFLKFGGRLDIFELLGLSVPKAGE